MKIFTIETETNNITVHTTSKDAEAVQDAERFRSEASLAKLATNWPATRLIEIWNSLPGATPVKKFTDRATAVSRIWKAIQTLGEVASEETGQRPETGAGPDVTATPVTPQTPDVATQAVPADKKANRTKKPPKGATKAKGAREGSKTETVIGLLKRAGGATASELIKATGWQAHSVRGFIAGTARKKMGLNIISSKGEDGERIYSVEA